ncbi:MAG TPA: PEP-CTERM sorting domain-containing protein [Fimbriimonadales bacterium]|nr:PEP-CTERM sorting domain-containing protein [Fimbriimonadales bacterium]
MRLFGSVLLLSIFSFALADELIWSNIQTTPDDLMNTQDAWTASRVNDDDFVSYRCAADDFFLKDPVQITRIVYYSVPISDPDVLGGDWYIFDATYPEGPPGTVITGEYGLKLLFEDTGWYNSNFGTNVYRNTLFPTNLVLSPGQYFLGFRTWQTFENGGGKNGILTTRWANGAARAYWNFGILEDGTANQDWVEMEIFNGIKDQEWAFEVYGNVVPEPSTLVLVGFGVLNVFVKRKKRFRIANEE